MELKRSLPLTKPRAPIRRVTPGHLARRAWNAAEEIAARKADNASLLGTILVLDANREKYEKAGDVGRARLQVNLIEANQARIDANDERIAYLEGKS